MENLMLKEWHLNLFDLILTDVNIKEFLMDNPAISAPPVTYVYLSKSEREAFAKAPRERDPTGYFNHHFSIDVQCSKLLGIRLKGLDDEMKEDNESRKKSKT
jgi:hypothetical protein